MHTYVSNCSWIDESLIKAGTFYPADARTPEARLRFYASIFSTVETRESRTPSSWQTCWARGCRTEVDIDGASQPQQGCFQPSVNEGAVKVSVDGAGSRDVGRLLIAARGQNTGVV